MTARRHLRVVICSGGRRVYIVRWFREAFAKLDVTGEVVVLDADAAAPAGQAADVFRQVPRVTDPLYRAAICEIVTELQPDLFLSLHDYELEVLSDGLAADLRSDRTAVLSLTNDAQLVAGDKWLLASRLDPAYSTPTLRASDHAAVAALVAANDRVVVKHRYGSASSGLSIVSGDDVHAAVARATVDAPRPMSASSTDTPEDWVVVQPCVRGTEYGMDAVFSVHGSHGGVPRGVSARRKLRMRAGETDQAVTVDPAPFQGVAGAIGALLEPRGLVDVDVIVDDAGRSHVIDINPRFGGGYPFTHLSGVDVPAFYLAEVLGFPEPEKHLAGLPGVMSAKYEEITAVLTTDGRP
ncbi:MAG: ATP-grasp domain-containing protein [Cellulomonas sp.]|uniref:ATP-grasp domain-containing protein n=1 Tax=Cellulomonas sp. TaxID=40001 RepID=UPI0019F23EDC|nr:ATP-grasp domain-containing protein [Cellulomonas sp.]MBF0689112.1 ATP-grasp domain-containing protein [Cellulomonas sp.]